MTRLVLSWVIGTLTAGLMLGARPAAAGQYLLDPAYHSGTPTGAGGIDPSTASPIATGSITTTSNGNSNQTPISDYCYATVSNGTLTGSGSLKWHFKWYPDSGSTYADDPPVDEVWEFRYSISASVGPYGATQAATASSTLSVADHTVTAAGSYTPGSYGMGGYVPGQFTGNPTSDSEAVLIELELTGETLTITHDVSAGGSAGLQLGAQVSIQSAQVNPKANEAIWHLRPKNQAFANGATIAVNGKWRGFQGVAYAIRQSISVPPDYPAGLLYSTPANREFGEVVYGTGVQGPNRDQSWTGRSLQPDYGPNQQGSPYQSNVRLWKWNAGAQQYNIDTGKHHEAPFRVTP